MSLALRANNRIQVVTPQDRQRSAEMRRRQSEIGGFTPVGSRPGNGTGTGMGRIDPNSRAPRDSEVTQSSPVFKNAPIPGRSKLTGGGYGIDLDNKAGFDPQTDGYLTFDLNKDGRMTREEVIQSKRILQSLGGDFDFDGDGKLSKSERFIGQSLKQKYAGMDRDGDGRLNEQELKNSGAVVATTDGRGNFQTHSLDSLPGSRQGGPQSRLVHMDLENGRSQIEYDPGHPYHPFAEEGPRPLPGTGTNPGGGLPYPGGGPIPGSGTYPGPIGGSPIYTGPIGSGPIPGSGTYPGPIGGFRSSFTGGGARPVRP